MLGPKGSAVNSTSVQAAGYQQGTKRITRNITAMGHSLLAACGRPPGDVWTCGRISDNKPMSKGLQPSWSQELPRMKGLPWAIETQSDPCMLTRNAETY